MKAHNFAALAACSLLLTAPPIPVLAQAPMPQSARRQDSSVVLGLTPAQKAKLTVLAQNANQQMMTVNASKSLAPAVRMAKMRAVGHHFTSQMMALLTPAQRVQAKAMSPRAQAKGWQHNGDTLYRYRFEDLRTARTRHL